MVVPLITLGEVLKPHGLAGEVKVRVLTDRPMERFRALRECILWEPVRDRRETFHIASCRLDGDTAVVKMDGINSPERARELAGRLLAVDRSQALPAPDGHFYPWEMEGARVETPDGRLVGRFARVEAGGAQDLWVVDDGNREHLIPAVAGIVVDVSVAARRIVIDPPDGLFEL